MFDSLSSKLESTFSKLIKRGVLGEKEVDEALAEIRVALLDADVNVKVVKEFGETVRREALGKKVIKSLSPGQMVVKVVQDELTKLMGKHEPLGLNHAPPVIIMMVGLQGSGKTTTSGKLARLLKEDKRRRPLLVSVDVYRPAAIEQLKTLGKNLSIEVFPSTPEQKPIEIATAAAQYAKNAGFDTLIIDTAGRLQIDAQMMNELVEIVEAVEPHEILLVVDAMTGQEAVNVARGFDESLDLDGLILSKLDGDTRGGAAISMRAVTGKPIKFIGLGEKMDALELFHPDRLVSRILGMGDILTLIEKASKEVDLEESKKLQKKLKKNEFSLEDFYAQLQSVKKLGSISSVMGMVPGMGKVAKGIDESVADKELKRLEAMILSMTPGERRDDSLIDGSRRSRIAKGSGTTVEDVNRLLKQFSEMKKVMKKVTSGANLQNLLRGGMPRMTGLR
ncbi:signal recognition particle protein [bacterium]|nr:signal recognition particle protein [bacterium]